MIFFDFGWASAFIASLEDLSIKNMFKIYQDPVNTHASELPFQTRFPRTQFLGKVVAKENGGFIFISASQQPKPLKALERGNGLFLENKVSIPLKERVVENP